MTLGMTTLEDIDVITASEDNTAVDDGGLDWASDISGAVPLDAGSGEVFDEVDLQYTITFEVGATELVEIHYRKSVDGGTTEDTPAVQTYSKSVDPANAVSNVVIGTLHVPGPFVYLDVGVKNLSTAGDNSEDIDWLCKYRGTKRTGMATS